MEPKSQIFLISDLNITNKWFLEKWPFWDFATFVTRWKRSDKLFLVRVRYFFVWSLRSCWLWQFIQNRCERPKTIEFFEMAVWHCIGYWYCLLAPVIAVWNVLARVWLGGPRVLGRTGLVGQGSWAGPAWFWLGGQGSWAGPAWFLILRRTIIFRRSVFKKYHI